MEIIFDSKIPGEEFALLYFISDKLDFPADLQKMLGSKNNITAIAKQFSFSGKKGETFSLTIEGNVVVFFGIGKKSEIKPEDLEALGGKCYATLAALKLASVAIMVESISHSNIEHNEVASKIASGIMLRSYNFNKYRTKEKPENKPKLTKICFVLETAKEAAKEWKEAKNLVDAIYLTRNLISEPPNVLYPETFEAECLKLKKVGLEIEVLSEEKLKSLGMNALLGVGQGSEKESRVVIMHYKGGAKNAKPLAFLGKGVTFDTGGISLKSAEGMDAMKYDMGGAGVVTGLMYALASRKAKVNAVGIIGLVENMPDGNAQRPGDIVKSLSGQTIEVLNTDAEGRLVLADILWYCQDRFKPQFMVNLATLTGAVVIALGSVYAGLFSNNDELSEKLIESSKKTSEKLWRFPIGEEYDGFINSPVADMQNISNEKGAGSITAAQFLSRFVNNCPWAHLDIAGVTWTRKDLDLAPKGSTAFGVRLLNQFVKDHYE